MPSITPKLAIGVLFFLLPSLALGQLAESDVSSRATPLVKVIQQIEPAVIALFVPGQKPNQFGSGSGTIIHPDGYALTNNHVVTRMDGIALYRDQRFKFVVVGRLPEKDIAVIRLLGLNSLPTLPLGHSHDIMTGESVVVSGNPGGRGIVFTSGIVSSTRALLGAPNALVMSQFANSRRDNFIQFDAASNRGNSGGPLVNMDGELIGIVSSLIPQEQNVSFAIPVDRVREMWEHVLEPEVVYQRTVGFEVNPHTDTADVTYVASDSAAGRAGLQVGDVLTRVFKDKIRNGPDWVLMKHKWLPANRPLDLVVSRSGKTVPIKFLPDASPAHAPVEVDDPEPGIRYQVFHGKFNALPNFAELEEVRSGVAEKIDLDAMSGDRKEAFAILLNGYMEVEEDGLYRMTVISDDGSRIFVHDRMYIDHDGNHPPTPASRLIRLQKGLHPIRIQFYDGIGGHTLQFKLERFSKESDGTNEPPFFYAK